jgi:hypothetical protein
MVEGTLSAVEPPDRALFFFAADILSGRSTAATLAGRATAQPAVAGTSDSSVVLTGSQAKPRIDGR